MKILKISFAFCILSVMHTHAAEHDPMPDHVRKLIKQNTEITSITSKPESPEVILYPYSCDLMNCGPSACNQQGYFARYGKDLVYCCYGDTYPTKSIEGASAPWVNFYWLAALSAGSKQLALGKTDPFEETYDLELYNIDQPGNSDKIETINVAPPGNYGAQPLFLFDTEESSKYFYYAQKTNSGIELVNHTTTGRLNVPTLSLFVSLLQCKKNLSFDKIFNGIGAAFTNENHDVLIYHPLSHVMISPLSGHTSDVAHVTMRDDAIQALSCAGKEIILWDIHNTKSIRKLEGTTSNYKHGSDDKHMFRDCCFAGPNNQLAVGFGCNGVQVWDLNSPSTQPTYQFMPGRIFYNGSASGNFIVAGGPNQELFYIPKQPVEASANKKPETPAFTETKQTASWFSALFFGSKK